MLSGKQRVGSEYIKLTTGNVVKWDNFDETTQLIEFRAPNGQLIQVHRRDIDLPTANEVIDFLRSQSKHSE